MESGLSLEPKDLIILVKRALESLDNAEGAKVHISPNAILPVSEGSEHRCWIIGEDLVIRLTAESDGLENLHREAALKAALVDVAARETLDLPSCFKVSPWIPISLTTGKHAQLSGAEEQTWTYSIDQRRHGLSLEEAPATAVTEFDLAMLLQLLQHPPIISQAKALGVPQWNGSSPSETEQAVNEAVAVLASKGYLDRATLARISTALDRNGGDTGFVEYPTVLLHADLKGEHILLSTASESTGHVTGVLDWCDAAIGPAWVDIEGLVIGVGGRAAKRIAVLAGYDETVAGMGLHSARCNTVLRLHDRLLGDDTDSPLSLLYRQLERAFE